jgi:hypothetical protein
MVDDDGCDDVIGGRRPEADGMMSTFTASYLLSSEGIDVLALSDTSLMGKGLMA